TSPEATIQIKSGSVVNGDFTGQTFDTLQMTGDGIVVRAGGGTDTLILRANITQIASINGMTVSAFSPTAGGPAIYQGLAVDYVRLTDGREIYFTGIERLQAFTLLPGTPPGLSGTPLGTSPVADNLPVLQAPQIINLAIKPNDPNFKDQWNLQIT